MKFYIFFLACPTTRLDQCTHRFNTCLGYLNTVVGQDPTSEHPNVTYARSHMGYPTAMGVLMLSIHTLVPVHDSIGSTVYKHLDLFLDGLLAGLLVKSRPPATRCGKRIHLVGPVPAHDHPRCLLKLCSVVSTRVCTWLHGADASIHTMR